MKLTLLSALILGFLAFSPLSYALENPAGAPATQEQTKPSAVFFFSETCGSCKILEPRMKAALKAINQDELNVVVFDFSNKEAIQETRQRASELHLENVLMQHGARTGFVSIVNSNGEEKDLINIDDSIADIEAKLVKAIATAP